MPTWGALGGPRCGGRAGRGVATRLRIRYSGEIRPCKQRALSDTRQYFREQYQQREEQHSKLHAGLVVRRSPTVIKIAKANEPFFSLRHHNVSRVEVCLLAFHLKHLLAYPS